MRGWSRFGLAALAVSQNISLGSSALDSWMLPTLQEEVMRWWRKRGWRELKTKPSMWLVLWTEAKARTEGGRRRGGKEGQKEGGRGVVFKPFKCPLEGSKGCQICGASQYWLPACVWVSFCIPVCADLCSSVRLSCVCTYTVPVCLEGWIIAPKSMSARPHAMLGLFMQLHATACAPLGLAHQHEPSTWQKGWFG